MAITVILANHIRHISSFEIHLFTFGTLAAGIILILIMYLFENSMKKSLMKHYATDIE